MLWLAPVPPPGASSVTMGVRGDPQTSCTGMGSLCSGLLGHYVVTANPYAPFALFLDLLDHCPGKTKNSGCERRDE